jgi:hypothetical protein
MVPGYVCYTYPDSGNACTIEKRVTRTRLVVTAAGCGLAAANWLRDVQQVRKRVTAAATIPAGVCNTPARALVLHNQAETVQQPSVWRTLALGELFTVRWRRIDCVQRTCLSLVGADPENNNQVPAGAGIRITPLTWYR